MRLHNRLACLLVLICLAPACADSGGGESGTSEEFTVVQPSGSPDAGATPDAAPDTSPDPLPDSSSGSAADVMASPDGTEPTDTAMAADAVNPGPQDAAVAPEDATEGPEDTSALESSPFVGRWALRYWVNSLTEVPVLGGIMGTVVLSLQVVDITETDAGLSFTVETCSVEMIAEDGAMNETILPDAFVDSIPVAERTAALTDDGQGFYAEPFYEVRGAQLDDLINSPLPTDPNDPAVIDQDQDGHPGMTISVTGFVDGDIYLVQRGWNSLETTSFDGDRAFGTSEWGDEQTYLGASSFVLEQITPSSWPDPDTSKHGFELVSAPEITCNQVLETTAAIFESH